MKHELSPEHTEVAKKASDRIKQSIARAVFKAAEVLDPREVETVEREAR